MSSREDWEDVVEMGDITLIRHKKNGGLIFLASDAAYDGYVTLENAVELLTALQTYVVSRVMKNEEKEEENGSQRNG